MTGPAAAPLCGGCEQRPAPKWRLRLPAGTLVPLCDPCTAEILGGAGGRVGVEQPLPLYDQDAPEAADLGRHPSASGRRRK